MNYKKGQILKDKMDIVKAWADGQEVQYKSKFCDRWTECELGSHLDIANNDIDGFGRFQLLRWN